MHNSISMNAQAISKYIDRQIEVQGDKLNVHGVVAMCIGQASARLAKEKPEFAECATWLIDLSIELNSPSL